MICQNFAAILRKKADNYPDKIAIVESHTGNEYTYLEMCHRTNQMARALMELGVGKGDRIVCMTRNTVEYLDIYLAVSTVGAILVTINFRLSPNEIKRIVDDALPEVMVFDAQFADKVQELTRMETSLKHFVMFGGNGSDWAIDYGTLMQKQSSEILPIAGDSEDFVVLMYTAGSTGRPKGVPIKHRNFFFKSQDIVVDMGFSKEDVSLTVLPLFHIGGNMLYTQAHLHVGAKIVLQAQFNAEETFKLIEKYKVTNTFLLPAMIKMMLQVPDWEKYNLSTIRFVGSGGEPVPERVIQAFKKYEFLIFNSYGLTETSGEMIFNRPERAKGKPAHCIGKPGTCREARIVDEQGNELGPDQPGEIAVQGPSVVDSYWNRPEESSKAFRNGWLFTGDKGVRDKEGYIYFLGRTDDMIVTGGENVYPAEIEETILNHPKVADVAVVGVPDEKWGQIIKAVIVPRKGEELSSDEVVTHVAQRLAGFKKPRIVQFVDELPRIASGKLDRKGIKQIYGGTA